MECRHLSNSSTNWTTAPIAYNQCCKCSMSSLVLLYLHNTSICRFWVCEFAHWLQYVCDSQIMVLSLSLTDMRIIVKIWATLPHSHTQQQSNKSTSSSFSKGPMAISWWLYLLHFMLLCMIWCLPWSPSTTLRPSRIPPGQWSCDASYRQNTCCWQASFQPELPVHWPWTPCSPINTLS